MYNKDYFYASPIQSKGSEACFVISLRTQADTTLDGVPSTSSLCLYCQRGCKQTDFHFVQCMVTNKLNHCIHIENHTVIAMLVSRT